MPKTYSHEIRTFAVLKRREGLTWDEVAKAVEEKFGVRPERRSMLKWTAITTTKDVVNREVNIRLINFEDKLYFCLQLGECFMLIPASKQDIDRLEQDTKLLRGAKSINGQ